MQGSAITEVGGEIFKNIFSISVIGIAALVGLGIIIGIIYYFAIYRKKFDIKVKINSERANEPYIVWDKAAILYDRATKSKYFRLLHTRVELVAPPFRIIQSTNKGDYMELLRKSEDDFVFLTPPRIDKKTIIRMDGKAYPVARMKQRQIEGDLYWMVKRKQEDKSWISPEGLFTKILQMLPTLIPAVFMLIILFIFIDRLPDILGSLANLIEKAESLEAARTKVVGG